ncbi:MAG: hypothetical protein OES26_23495 [Gammaproteobacteria bacterium]|nr:hypothetical protein [Gammaproteobacteria bacterium]
MESLGRDRINPIARTVAPSIRMPRLNVTTASAFDAFDITTATEAE